ncbi:MAG: response regulator [Proteobacteria bacterium]|nr:response regulator [Pseudomonadota bacterium]
MDLLQNFSDKDMIEQITILDDIQSNAQHEAIPALFDIYAVPLSDVAVDEMVYHALITLLKGQDAAILSGLGHGSPRVRILCVKAAGENNIHAALPLLAEILQTGNQETELLTEAVRALSKIDDPGILDILLPYINHQDATIAGLAMDKAAASGEERGRDALCSYISAACQDGGTDESLGVGLAFSKLGNFTDDKTIDFLISHIHNHNPTIRKIVHEQVIKAGEIALQCLAKALTTGDKDEKIMAANIIGLIKHKNGANIITDLLDSQEQIDANLKFAAYEALGRIPSMRSIVGLTDGLADSDEMILIAVMTGLNEIYNPGLAKALLSALQKDAGQRARILSALVATRAGKLFTAVFQDGTYMEELLGILAASHNLESITFFKELLASMADDKAAELLKKLEISDHSSGGKSILAADDSKAMLFFYTSALAGMDVCLTTAEDGQQAFNLLKSGERVDLLVTDLNMPNMDGVELVKEIRNSLKLDIPILMASTESEKSQTDLALQAGVSAFITKPFTKEQFIEKVTALIR